MVVVAEVSLAEFCSTGVVETSEVAVLSATFVLVLASLVLSAEFVGACEVAASEA
ncbi:MAG: hypothetical protein HDT50_01355 [Lactobacillus sp.]|nr:hypothetical protein [Lactobacillus sp.]